MRGSATVIRVRHNVTVPFVAFFRLGWSLGAELTVFGSTTTLLDNQIGFWMRMVSRHSRKLLAQDLFLATCAGWCGRCCPIFAIVLHGKSKSRGDATNVFSF